jgi:hypothetical protein
MREEMREDVRVRSAVCAHATARGARECERVGVAYGWVPGAKVSHSKEVGCQLGEERSSRSVAQMKSLEKA